MEQLTKPNTNRFRSVATAAVTIAATGFLAPSVANAETLRMGTFTGANAHTASGKVVIKTTESGKRLLKLSSDFKVSDPLTLRLWLSSNRSGTGRFVSLGALKQSGKQTFTVKSSIKLSDYKYAVIWCKDGKVSLGHAKLTR